MYLSLLSPARLGDHHFSADVMELFPQLAGLQLHCRLLPDPPVLGAVEVVEDGGELEVVLCLHAALGCHSTEW